VRLVYGVLHGLVLPVWRGMGSRPRRTHSRLGGAAVVLTLITDPLEARHEALTIWDAAGDREWLALAGYRGLTRGRHAGPMPVPSWGCTQSLCARQGFLAG
jgi:hypothetical protein